VFALWVLLVREKKGCGVYFAKEWAMEISPRQTTERVEIGKLLLVV